MKTCILFVFIVALWWVEVNADCPPLDNPQGKHTVKEGTVFDKNCSMITCKNNQYEIKGCSLAQCSSHIKQTPYDYSKPYPECCPQITCS